MSLYAALAKAENLGDVDNPSKARGNIGGAGLGTTGIADDFLGPVLRTDLWSVNSGTDAQAVDPVINVQNGGVVRCVSGNAGTGVAADGSQLVGALQWQPDQGKITAEFRVTLSAITNIIVNVGFTDSTTLELPFEIGSSDALTSTATDAVCFVFDTGADTDNWFVAGVDGGTDAGPTDVGSAPVATTFENFKIILNTNGEANFFRNGVFITSLANAFDETVQLAPTVVVSADTTTSVNVDVDYIYVMQELSRGEGPL